MSLEAKSFLETSLNNTHVAKWQFEQIRAVGYSWGAAERLLGSVGGMIKKTDDIDAVISSLEYKVSNDLEPNHGRLDEAARQARCTCFEAALIAHDLVGLLGLDRKILALNRMDPESGSFLGHAALIYETHIGRFGAFALSRHATQCSRPANFNSPNEVAISYAEEYLTLGFVPVCFGIATLEEVGGGINWRLDPEDFKVLHDRILETQVNVFELLE